MPKLLTILCFGLLSSYSLGATESLWRGLDLSSGRTIELDLSGAENPKVFVFVSAECPCSQSHESELFELRQKYPQIEWLGIHSNQDEMDENQLQYYQKGSWPFPVLQDKEAQIAGEFRATKTPHVFVKDSSGELLYTGAISNRRDLSRATRFYLREVLEDLQEGRPPRHRRTLALGCNIRR